MAAITRTDASGKNLNVEVEVVQIGQKLIIPDNVTPGEASALVNEWAKEQDRIVAVNEVISGHPMDALIALTTAMESMFGAIIAEGKKGLFGDQPPAIMSVELGYDENGVMRHAKVPWGIFKLIGVDGKIALGITMERGKHALVVNAQVKQKDKGYIHNLVNLARKNLMTSSIYKGQAFAFAPVTQDNRSIAFDNTPQFINTTKTDPSKLILPQNVHIQIQDSVFTPVLKTAECRKSNIPLKRGVLMAGTYGVGKTLTASILAHYAVKNNWTFIHVTQAEDIPQAIGLAKDLQPAIVFCEDVDRVVSGGRSANMDNILNTIDGVSGKNDELMFVFTTNDLSNINGAMLRPGRIDVYIEFTPPDGPAAERLIRSYGGDLITSNTIMEAANKLAGRIPAEIREVVNKAALSRISTGNTLIEQSDLLRAITIMEPHFALLDRQRENDNKRGQNEHTIENQIMTVVRKVIKEDLGKTLEEVRDYHS